MRQMPWAARIYLVSLYAIGFVAFGWLTISHDESITIIDIVLAIGLTIVSAICQVFLVARTSTTDQRSPLHRMLFNLGTVLLAAGGADVISTILIGGTFTSAPLLYMIVPAAVARAGLLCDQPVAPVRDTWS
jgi:hypothetical protein